MLNGSITVIPEDGDSVVVPISVVEAALGATAPGTYIGTITVTSASGQIATAPITLIVVPEEVVVPPDPVLPDLTVSKTVMNLTVRPGSPAPFDTATVTNIGGPDGSLGFSITADPRLLVSTSSAVAPATLTVSSTSQLPFTGLVTIDPVQAGDPSMTITVNVAVNQPVSAAPSSLSFTTTGSSTVSLSGNTPFGVSDDATWITTSISGSTLTVNVSTAGLSAGARAATVTVIDADGEILQIPVTLVIAGAPSGSTISPNPAAPVSTRFSIQRSQSIPTVFPRTTYSAATPEEEELLLLLRSGQQPAFIKT